MTLPSLTQPILQALEQDKGHVKLKTVVAGSKWKGNCPWRPDADDLNFGIEMKGGRLVWHDYKTDEAGGEIELAKHYNISLSEPGTEFETSKRAYHSMKDYAEAHGVPEQVFLDAKWAYVTTFPILKADGTTITMNKPALRIPTATGYRYRIIDGGKLRFIQDSGQKNCWFGLFAAIKLAQEKGYPLVYVNGNPTVVVAHHYGIPAFTQSLGGEHKIDADLLAELGAYWDGDILLVGDTDKSGRVQIQEIAAQLPHRHAVLDLDPTSQPESGGMDLADWLNLMNTKPDDPKYPATIFWQKVSQVKWQKTTKQEIQQYGLAELARASRELERAWKGESLNEEDQDVEKVLARVESIIVQVREKVLEPSIIGMDTALDLAMTGLDTFVEGGITGIPTGLHLLDQSTGGLQRGTSLVFMGAMKQGKTTLLATIASNIIRAGYKVLIVPTEMGQQLYTLKMLSAVSGIPTRMLLRQQVTPQMKREMIEPSGAMLKGGGAFLPVVAPSLSQLRSGVNRAVNEMHVDVLLVDAVSNLAPATDAGKQMEYYLLLMELMAQHRLGGLLSIQANSAKIMARPRGERAPRVDDMYGTQRAGQDATGFFGVYNHNWYVHKGYEDPDPKYPTGTIALIQLLQRFGGDEEEDESLMTFGFPRGTAFTNLKVDF